jgi:hypothetical protein
MISVSPSGQQGGRQGSRTLISTRENRVSSAARQAVSGYLPFFSVDPPRVELDSSSGSGSRTPAVQAYEARMSTGPPASNVSCRSRYRAGRVGLMKPNWAPAHLQSFCPVARMGVEPTSRRSERPVLPLNDTASVFFANTHRSRQVCRQGSGGRNRTCDLVVQSHASRTNSDDPGMLPAVRVPCGNRTRLSSLEGWCLSRSAKGTCCPGGRSGSRTRKAVMLVPLRTGCHRQLDCPSVPSRLRWQESDLRQGG